MLLIYTGISCHKFFWAPYLGDIESIGGWNPYKYHSVPTKVSKLQNRPSSQNKQKKNKVYDTHHKAILHTCPGVFSECSRHLRDNFRDKNTAPYWDIQLCTAHTLKLNFQDWFWAHLRRPQEPYTSVTSPWWKRTGLSGYLFPWVTGWPLFPSVVRHTDWNWECYI